MSAQYEIAHTWEEPEGLVELQDLIRNQRPSADLRKIRYAYFMAEQWHSGQVRKSGEPYISHPLAVAHILAELKMDDDSIVAGLLHDVIEDCGVSRETIAQLFGEQVAQLVEGVTKLAMRHTRDSTQRRAAAAETARAAESLRKMLLAVAKDVRVMVIKLADRLHNMRTLSALRPEQRTRIAAETHSIYAPLAARLGIWQIKWQLEDLAFKELHPEEFQAISDQIAKSRHEREAEISEAVVMLKERLESKGLQGAEVKGRPKHLYSIFNKMVTQGLEFDQVLDIVAIRVIVRETQECYLALGIVHDLWMPLPGLFFDHIAKPKSNGYQSLHTKVVGPRGDPLEVQIRTREMHEVAEYGVASHWMYKENLESGGPDKLARLRQHLFDWSSENAVSSDFLRSLSTDLFSEQTFVFTPKGDVIDLPKDSTVIDFAFRVHTALGLATVGAKVNGVMAPLRTVLQNGDVVELITRSNAQPSLDWLEFAKSAHARSKLRAYFRRRNRADNEARGKDAIEKELRAMGFEPREHLGEERLLPVAKQIRNCESVQDLFAKVGEGLVSVQNVVNKLRGTAQSRPKGSQGGIRQDATVTLSGGLDQVMYRRARCCDPIPGDEVIGYITRGRGIMIHRKVCPNALRLMTNESERLVPIDWPTEGKNYSVLLKIIMVNRQGLLMDISTILGESKVNVAAGRIRTMPNQTAEFDITVEVPDAQRLQEVMNQISNFSDVISILRMFGRTAGK